MTLLAIDTSTDWGSVAVHDAGLLLAEETWRARRHDDALFDAVVRVLELAGRRLQDVGRVAVAIGPGSFTGLRIGISAAQGLARARGAAAIGISTLDVVAHPYAGLGLRVCAVLPAGRADRYAALYGERQGGWGRTGEVLVVTPAELARHVALDTVFAGEVDDATAQALRAQLGPRARLAVPAMRPRRAAWLAELAWEKMEAGERVEPAQLEPAYVKPAAVRGPAGELLGAAPGGW